MKRLFNIALFLNVFLLMVSVASAADLAREKRLADEIVDGLLDGDAIYLKAGNHAFLSIYTEADAEQDPVRGTVIILHGRGFHPDWVDTVNPLRVGLLDSGWNTLSLQMPVLEKQAKYYDYVPLFSEAIPRIDAAILYSREQLQAVQSKTNVVLVAHSCGAHMAMAWSEVRSFKHVDAYVGIGMGATDYKQPMRHAFPLTKINVPVLDIYAENDYPAVIKMADERYQMIKQAGNEKSRQVVVDNANHYYTDRGEALTRVISQWLQTL